MDFFWISSKRQQPRVYLASFSICQWAWELVEGVSVHSTNKHFLSAYLVPGTVFTMELQGSCLPEWGTHPAQSHRSERMLDAI